jgi:hypothetical protein
MLTQPRQVARRHPRRPQRRRLGRLRSPEHRQPFHRADPHPLQSPRRSLPGLRRPQRRLLRRQHLATPPRAPLPLHLHDVPQCAARHPHPAQHQYL